MLLTYCAQPLQNYLTSKSNIVINLTVLWIFKVINTFKLSLMHNLHTTISPL